MPFKLIPILLLLGAALPLQADIDGRNNGAEASKQDRTAPSSGKLDFQTDLFTGRFSYGVPIQVAPARHGTEPQLGLRYNSSAGNGWCGVGWELEIGHIQRETKYGVPVRWTNSFPVKEYDSSKGFTFSLGGNGCPLVAVGPNDYRAETETAFLRFALITNSGGNLANYWQVTDKSGNNYFFGLTSNSRMANSKTGWPSNEARGTFRWALSRVETANGDVTTVAYTNFGGMIYPTLLAYNGHTNSLSPTHTVGFQLEDRPDGRLAFNSGYRVQTSKRLANVTNLVGGRLVRRYQLNYTNSPSTLKSLLSSVTLFGTNSSSSLPPVTFSYSVQAFGFQSPVTWTNLNLFGQPTTYQSPYNSNPNGLFADLLDMDGDGLPDRLVTATNAGSPWTYFLFQRNTGAGFADPVQWSPVPSAGRSNVAAWCMINSAYTRCLDINGDGLPDRVLDNPGAYTNTTPNTNYTNFVVELNQGAGFASEVNWTNVLPTAESANDEIPHFLAIEHMNYVKMADMNGDGLPDRVMRGWQLPDSQSIFFTNLWIQFNTGSGFTGTNWFGPYYSQGYWYPPANGDQYWSVEAKYVRLLDINADGLPDRVMMPYAYGYDPSNPEYGPYFTNFVVEFNNGSGFEPGEYWPGVNPMYAVPSCSGDSDAYQYRTVWDTEFVAFRDINGDGLPDRVMRRYCDATTWFVQINTGAGFGPTNAIAPVNRQGGQDAYASVETNTCTLIDINGDGLPDRVVAKLNGQSGDTYFVVELNKGPFPDLLSVVSNGIGGSVSVAYVPATRWDNRESTNSLNGRRLLQFPFSTVASVSVSDGLYPSNTTTYTYDGGMWSSARREFNGFASATVTDPLGGATKHWFHQAGGRDNSSLGEYQDTTNNFAKRGFPFRLETRGTNGQLYNLLLNKVEEAVLDGGRRFPFISQTLAVDYPGNTNAYRAACHQFTYDTATGNLTATVQYGEVTNINASTHSFQGVGDDSVWHLTAYAALANTNILDKPQRTATTADAQGQQILQESLYDHDGQTGNLTRQRNRICDQSYNTNRHGYDTYGNNLWTTNEAGVGTQFAYESSYFTFPSQQTISGYFTSTTVHDPLSGALVSLTDAKGLVTLNSYDAFSRLSGTWISTTPNGAASLWVARYDYGLGGLVAGGSGNYVRIRRNDDVDSTNGHETWTYYDGLGRVLQMRVEAETGGYRVTDTVYEQRGAALIDTQPYFSAGSSYTLPSRTNFATVKEFDPAGRLAKVTAGADVNFTAGGVLQSYSLSSGDSGSPVGSSTTGYSDGNDPWVIVRADEETKTKKYHLDAFGRTNQITELTSQGNFTTTLTYDKTGMPTNIIDQSLNRREYAYNDLGQLVAMADPDLGVWQFRRDYAGRIREQTDAKGNRTVFSYENLLGRLECRLAYDANGGLAYGLTNTYDSSDDPAFTVYAGQLYRSSDSEGWQKHGYDVRNRTVKIARFLSKNGHTYTTQSVYDDADRVRTNIYPAGGPSIRNAYDTGGNLAEVRRIDGSNNLVFYQPQGFNAMSQIVGITFGNGVASTNDYYPRSKRLKRFATFKSGTSNIQDLAYTYDRVSNLKSIADGVYSNAASATLTNLAYDDLHRLTSVTRPAVGQTLAFAYSSIGNVTANGECGSDAYDYGSRLPHAVKRIGNRRYAYDANGNMSSRNGQRLEYGPENRLVRWTFGASKISFGYDSGGVRLWKEGTNSLQVWIGEFYEEKQGRVLYHILAGNRLVCTFDATETNVFEYYHSDHLRSTSVLTDRVGNRVQHHEYSAYGRDRFTESSSAFLLSHRYTSQVLDEDTGLYYYNARYYDPELARFIQPDTVIPDPWNPQSYNRYSYVYNNPLKYVDPTGHEAVDWFGPEIATIRGSFALDAAAQRLGERSGRGWLGYVDAVRDIGIGQGTGNAECLERISGAGRVAGAATEVYLMGMQEIATAGMATVASPTAASRVGEAAGSAGGWSRVKSFFGRGGGEPPLPPRVPGLGGGAEPGRLGTLTKIGENAWESSGGLRYTGLDKAGRNRIEHVLEHLTPDASKKTHSLFNVERNRILGLLDEAWAIRGSPLANDPGAYVIPMGRIVGANGESSIKLVVRPGTSEVITAYPIP